MPVAASTKLMSYRNSGAPGTLMVSPVNVTDSSADATLAVSRIPRTTNARRTLRYAGMLLLLEP